MVYVVNYAHEIIILINNYWVVKSRHVDWYLGFKLNTYLSWWLNALMLLFFFSSTLFPSVLSLPPSLIYVLLYPL